MIAHNKDFLEMIEAAIKAPSGHNTQPWLFKIEEDKIIIVPNYSKTLDVVDPDNRELFISLGCATENLTIAASKLGYKSEVQIENNRQIIIQLKKSEIIGDPLFSQIDRRQTNRTIYDSTIIADSILEKCMKITPVESNISICCYNKLSSQFDTLTQYVMKGNEKQMGDAIFIKELKSMMRYNKKESESTNDGLSYEVFGAPNLPVFISKPIMSTFLNSKKQNKSDKKKIESSSHFILFTTENNDTDTWIKLGIYMERFLLNLTKENIVHAYMNQPCEDKDLQSQLSRSLSLKEQIPQILIRVGYGKPTAYSKRKDISQVIFN